MKEINFRPKARLIKILGKQLIKDATVGIIELIKNSYDADATTVELIFDSIIVQNNCLKATKPLIISAFYF
jgi:DNA mismatch repair ATPase MutL